MLRKEQNLKKYSRVASSQPPAHFSASRIRNATDPVPLALDPILSNGRTSSLMTRKKSQPILQQLARVGLMLKPLKSTRQ
jgi:hypothetical protein